MSYGQQVAKRWKRQYCKRGKWTKYADWHTQPESLYVILQELKSKTAIEALLNKSWCRYLRSPSWPTSTQTVWSSKVRE